ncbi:Uncharacterised protein [Mycobacteroides abscessus subsp. massiliense]|uniref:hypothetical protein n=1 Tax=Mycobacteroides abscessus TaxID=36809 RepID=UPI0009A7F3CF|nr:hypothetical protein [Mycobacteroides abscessus]SKM82160.1 Uncharacterised protein [Mycobacteroides abscessus subsp. massiliense]SKM98859.1 Uncharacterised protein [Mycobacteroides abscessus subsp. massiliense]SKN77467.1 Uncharacterised protein [Mycobacteroides abscessus subsp. massiliense]SKN95741.1 Uncharacterised protein [Mycobacteroides abscessus subsp. massiliense]SKO22722.1 Uncharacterised protein [Mycobacteroides abscessus subsp. massiliense]
MAIDDLPDTGDDCLCCAGQGVLPAAEVNGRTINSPFMVDGPTIQKCCAACIEALFFGAHHPHKIATYGVN